MADSGRREFVPREEASVLPQYLENVDAEVKGTLLNFPVVRDENFDPETVKREGILDFGDEGFLLYGVLSPLESRHIVTWGEDQGFQEILGVRDSYRSCKRIMVQSDELSELLWSRIAPYLNPIDIQGDPHDIHIHGIESLIKGMWEPYGLNNIFRLCRYYPGGHFAPHFDGHFVQTTRERSMKTLMLYLNGDFQGGTTNFVDENQTLYMDDSGKYCAEEKNIQYRVQPAEGMAILFNHHRLHEGGALGSGVKYILRTDIMYRKTDTTEIDPKEEEALQLVQEAERLEARGETMEAMGLYRKAFKMSPTVAKAYGN